MEVYAAGAVAAFTVDILVYPLDTLKTRYQSQDFAKTYGPPTSNRALAPRGLYQGIGSVILATLPAAGLFFSTYESTKNVFSRSLPLPQPLVHSSASAVAEMASCLVLAPAEVIKQNAQMLRANAAADPSSPAAARSTSLRALRQLAGAGAGRRLFSGYTALVARNLPFTALQFPMFEHLRSLLGARRASARPSGQPRGLLETGLVSGGSAGSAGAVAAWLTTPSDVVKTRMMLAAGDEGAVGARQGNHEARSGAWSTAREVYRERGLRGFFRGGLFRSAWTALGSGLYLGSYDMAKEFLTRDKPDADTSARL